MRQAAILLRDACAGLAHGSLVRCGDRPLLAWQIRELLRFGVDEVLLLSAHASPALEAALPAIHARLPRPVSLSIATVRGGTGGALLDAADRLDDAFLLLDGGSILDFNFARLSGLDRSAIVRRDPARADRSVTHGPERVGAGIYQLTREALEFARPGGSLEADTLPALAAAGRLETVTGDGWFVDLGTPGGLADARSEIPDRFLHRRALMLDRDGTINRDHGWVGDRSRWEWMPGAREAIAAATEAGWHVFVVTNQSGIARGFYDEAAFHALHAWVASEVRRSGGTIDDVRYCPYHEEGAVAAYRRASDWRKPAPGMILDLIGRWELDPGRCVLVGDQPSDLAAARAAGIDGFLFEGGDLRETVLGLLG